MKYYNQKEHPEIPFGTPEFPDATFPNCACGVCSAVMIVENMTDFEFPLAEAAKLDYDCGARTSPGTDMKIFAPAFCEKFGLTFKGTSDPDELLDHLHNHRGLAILHSGGDQEGYVGLLSHVGHYLVAYEANGTELAILDPGMHEGRYDIPERRDKARVGPNREVYVDVKDVAVDCASRTPSFYLFYKK